MCAISKETFVKTIEAIQKEHERISNFNDAIGKIADGSPVVTLGDGYLYALLDVLNQIFNEGNAKYPTIEWWLFETVDKKIFISPEHCKNDTGIEIEIDVTTPEQLYNYLVRWC